MSSDEPQTQAPEGSVPASGPLVALPTGLTSIEALVSLRESRGISPGEIASRLRLAPRQIAALERGEWQALPGPAFVRGTLRAYGRVLQVDVGPLLGAIEPQLPGAAVFESGRDLRQPMPRSGALGFGGSGSGSRLVWMLLAVLALFALAFFYGGGPTLLNRDLLNQPSGSAPPDGSGSSGKGEAGNGSSEDASSPTSTPSATPTPGASPRPGASMAPGASPTPAGGAQVASQAPGPAAVAVSAGGLPASGPGAPGSSVAALAPPQAAAGASNKPVAQSAKQGLVMSFSGDAWIEVRDAENRVVAFGTQSAGTVREFLLAPPLTLVIGNAVAATVSWYGKVVDLSPHMRQGVARFRLD